MAHEFFVLQVMTGEEQRFISLALDALQHAPDQQGDYRFWWPRRKLTIRRRGRRFRTLAPMFPGYVFLEADAVTESLFRQVRRVTGFVRFLKDNHDIRPLPPEDQELVRHFLSFGEIVTESKVTFDKNNRIVVQEGPLKGLEGNIVKVDRRKGRAKVRLDIYEDAFLIDLGFEVIAHGANTTSSGPSSKESA